MSKVEILKCDNCGKSTEDYYAEEGWIIFEGLPDFAAITITHGRRDDGMAITSYRHLTDNLSFCSVECLVEYLNNLDKREGD